MALLDNIRRDVKGPVVPGDIDQKLARGRKAMLKDAPKRRLCMRFERGDTYWYINSKSMLSFQPTVTDPGGSGKPPHRIRNKINFIRPIVEGKVSAATQRIPSYDISPSNTDPDNEGAARLAEAVALYGYDKWRLRNVSIKVVKLAIAGGGDGFAMPYFDANVGPFIPVDQGDGKTRNVGVGEIKVLVLSGNEVYWEPGVDFIESRWIGIERARPVDEVERIPNFVPGLKLTPDATTSDIPTDRDQADNLVMVTEYYERPSAKYPDGRRMTIANGHQITDARLTNPATLDPWEQYPLQDSDGKVLDEPCVHRLSYTLDPETDRDFGLVWQLIDPQRTLQDIWNKLLEWKNRCLNPQMLAPIGSMVQRRTDEPGITNYYKPVATGEKPEWERPPEVPQALFQMLTQMQADLRQLGADVNVDNTDAAARTLQQIIEQSNNRWQSFLGDVADFHSRLMRHCLLLVARYYTEPRLLQIRGRFGPYTIQNFQGAHLLGQVNVTVLPGSLENRTREQITNQVLAFFDRGMISGEAAMAAINGGNAEKLVESYELDVARANRIIQKIREGTVMQMGTWEIPNPLAGQPMGNGAVAPASIETPIFMPTQQDNLNVWKSVFSDWMKTEEYEQSAPPMQEVSNQIFAGVLMLEAQQQQKAMLAQEAQAAQLGMGNASKPQRQAPQMPDQRKLPATT